ncbi:MAG TPA: aminoacyl-tRNA hydrolase [Pseudomonadales bacterium]|nr:aminoacyl-tRNA hydrolase [Pseudomonadales bacterium]
MSTPIKLIVGLGNPGSQYANTRHNAGQDLVERLASQYNTSLSNDGKFFGDSGRIFIGSRDVRLLVPTTFMNRSGQSVAALANFYRIEPDAILVVHDELDLPPGIARLKQGGGHGGHNGLRDIISALGNNKDFQRLRIGIGHPGNAKQVSGYVLKKASGDDAIGIDHSIDESIKILPALLAGDLAGAMQELHSKLKA